MKAHETLPTILHPTDLSEHSGKVMEVACNLARARKGKLVLLHVVPRLVPVAASAGVHELYKAEHAEADLQHYRAEMTRRLEQLPVPDPKLPVERRIAEGDVAEEILQFADSRCDLIVMGAHTGVTPVLPLLGSAAEEVMQKAHCPVVIVKEPTAIS
jgi:universal stress protein A